MIKIQNIRYNSNAIRKYYASHNAVQNPTIVLEWRDRSDDTVIVFEKESERDEMIAGMDKAMLISDEGVVIQPTMDVSGPFVFGSGEGFDGPGGIPMQ